MKKNKRIWTGLLATVMASSMMLAGCGGDKTETDTSTSAATDQTNKDSSSSTAAPSTNSSSTGEQVTLKVMHNG